MTVYTKLDEPRDPLVVNVVFPIGTDSGPDSEITLTIWFEDDLLCEVLLEGYQCDAIIGMIDEKLPLGSFVTDVPKCWEYPEKYDKIHLQVYRGVELY